MRSLVLVLLTIGTVSAHSVAVARPIDFKTNCDLASAGGCDCRVVEGNIETYNHYDDVNNCRKGVEFQTADNKKSLNAEIKQKFGAFKENCFPKPSGGCKCNVDYGNGEEVVAFNDDKDCRKSIEQQTADNKQELNAEIKEKFGAFRENCFPKPSGGCKCNEKNARGEEVVTAYNDPQQCKVRSKRATTQVQNPQRVDINGDRTQAKSQIPSRSRTGSLADDQPSQNVRDPVREKAQANYQAVVNELKEKFKNLKEGCFPRPKGCLCVIGKTPEGRDVTERRMDEKACRCQPGEKGQGCDAA